jgi:hypothetical protein
MAMRLSLLALGARADNAPANFSIGTRPILADECVARRSSTPRELWQTNVSTLRSRSGIRATRWQLSKCVVLNLTKPWHVCL